MRRLFNTLRRRVYGHTHQPRTTQASKQLYNASYHRQVSKYQTYVIKYRAIRSLFTPRKKRQPTQAIQKLFQSKTNSRQEVQRRQLTNATYNTRTVRGRQSTSRRAA